MLPEETLERGSLIGLLLCSLNLLCVLVSAVGKDKKQVTWNELIMGVGFRLSSLQSLLPHTQGSGGYAIVKMTVIKRDRRTSLPDAAGYLSSWPWKNRTATTKSFRRVSISRSAMRVRDRNWRADSRLK